MLILEANENKTKPKFFRLYLSECTTLGINLHINIKPTVFSVI